MDPSSKYKPLDEGHNRTQALQDQVHGVQQVMADTIEKAVKRGDRIDLLADQSDNLQMEAKR